MRAATDRHYSASIASTSIAVLKTRSEIAGISLAKSGSGLCASLAARFRRRSSGAVASPEILRAPGCWLSLREGHSPMTT